MLVSTYACELWSLLCDVSQNWCGRGPETDVGGTWNWCGRGPETKMQVGMALANYVCWRAHPVNMFSSSNVTAKPLVTIGKKVPITCVRSVMITTSFTTVQMVCMGCGFTSGWPGWCLHLCSYEQNTGKKCYIESLSSVPKDKKAASLKAKGLLYNCLLIVSLSALAGSDANVNAVFWEWLPLATSI